MQPTKLLFGFLALSAACAVEDMPIDEPIADPTSVEIADGDDGDGAPQEQPSFPERTADFSANSPCGERTVEVLTVAPEHTVAFCQGDDGLDLVIETAPLGHPAVVPANVSCAATLYAQLSPGSKVPNALQTLCAEGDFKQSVRPIALDGLPQDGEVDSDAYASYCNGSGDANFAAERCSTGGFGSGTTKLCRSSSVTWHQRTCKATVGDWCRSASQQIASCNGSTRFLVTERKRTRNSFSTFYDYDVHSGYWSGRSIIAASRPGSFGWYDWDFRMIGDSYSSAFHRYAISFLKN